MLIESYIDSLARYLLSQRDPKGPVFVLLGLLKWCVHQYRGHSHIEHLCLWITQPCTGLKERQAAYVNIIAHVLLSKRLSGAVRTEQSAKLLSRAIASIKKIAPDGSTYLTLENAVTMMKGVDHLGSMSLINSKVPTCWKNHEILCQDAYSAVFSKDGDDVDNGEKVERDALKMKWSKLGFQGTDPCTDFRSTGLFGLECLRHFCVYYPTRAQQLISQSQFQPHDALQPWYPFALVSIHLSQMILDLTENRLFLYNLIFLLEDVDKPTAYEETIGLLTYELHGRLLEQFHQFWLDSVESGQVSSVLDVEACLARFRNELTDKAAFGAIF